MKDCIILFVSVSVVGVILMPGKFTGTVSLKKEIASFIPT
jgi:hypothetical protein